VERSDDRKVVCLETQETFGSPREAAFYFRIPSPRIRAVCEGKQQQTMGHTFRYLDDILAAVQAAQKGNK
jgi:hypothetical protein